MKKFEFKPIFSKSDYILFLRKYRNLLLFRGKSSLSYKFFDKILIEFKKKYKKAPYINIYKAIYNLVPFFGFLKQKVGYRIKSVPALITPHRRIILLLKWFVRDFKNRIFFRTRGYDVNYLANVFVQAASEDGRAWTTADNYKQAIVREKFNLKRSFGRKNTLLRKYQKMKALKRRLALKKRYEEMQKSIRIFKRKNRFLYRAFKRLEFLIPQGRRRRKFILNLKKKKFKKLLRRSKLKKKLIIFFFRFLKRLRSKRKKTVYLNWFAQRIHLYENKNYLDNRFLKRKNFKKDFLNKEYLKKKFKKKFKNKKEIMVKEKILKYGIKKRRNN